MELKLGETKCLLPLDHYITYNGVKVHWFIGDFNFTGQYWEAWGSCNNRAYQMAAKYGGSSELPIIKGFFPKKRLLYDIVVLKKLEGQNNSYFNQENYNLLTTKK